MRSKNFFNSNTCSEHHIRIDLLKIVLLTRQQDSIARAFLKNNKRVPGRCTDLICSVVLLMDQLVTENGVAVTVPNCDLAAFFSLSWCSRCPCWWWCCSSFSGCSAMLPNWLAFLPFLIIETTVTLLLENYTIQRSLSNPHSEHYITYYCCINIFTVHELFA